MIYSTFTKSPFWASVDWTNISNVLFKPCQKNRQASGLSRPVKLGCVQEVGAHFFARDELEVINQSEKISLNPLTWVNFINQIT